MAKKDLTGQKFGMLTVIKEAGRNKRSNIIWECRCDCGKIHYAITQDLTSGHTKSCGCNHWHTKHKMSKTRLYQIWQGMKQRCYNKKKGSYKDYGGRGITICDEWLNDFIAFKNWAMENGYNDSLSIDRIDVNKSYNPKNCRWATKEEQENNKTTNLFIKINGVTKTLKQWSDFSGINYKTVQQRYYRGIRGTDLIAPVKHTEKKK